jgi:hypothetical protein
MSVMPWATQAIRLGQNWPRRANRAPGRRFRASDIQMVRHESVSSVIISGWECIRLPKAFLQPASASSPGSGLRRSR